MILWWIGNIVLLLVVPVVIVLLQRVKKPVKEIKAGSDVLAGTSASLVVLLDAVDQLPKTRELVGQTGAGVSRYGAALDEILG
jgi:hypothetical protein